MKIESVLEMTMNTRGATAALLPQPHLACCGHAAVAETMLAPEKKAAAPPQSSSLNQWVRTHLTGPESGTPIGEKISFAMIIALGATAVMYLMTAADHFVGAFPHFSHFVQGCL